MHKLCEQCKKGHSRMHFILNNNNNNNNAEKLNGFLYSFTSVPNLYNICIYVAVTKLSLVKIYALCTHRATQHNI